MSISYYIQISILFAILILGQVFVFDLIHIVGFGKVMVYPLLLLMIPTYVPSIIIMTVGFVIGFVMDFLLGTGGLHTAAMTFMGFSRNYIIQMIMPNLSNENKDKLIMEEMGINRFIVLIFVCVFIHQFVYYFIERFSFHNFIYTLRRIGTGTLLSTFIISLIALLIVKIDKRR
ncbi:MAG: hypothetical protein LC105_12875 [Chitinophagales bacterium]|nr:hypothetical protein [Chitinophagales bacterium]MCZ2394748.1 hypothetical protein [Chitinophagales bacterium]